MALRYLNVARTCTPRGVPDLQEAAPQYATIPSVSSRADAAEVPVRRTIHASRRPFFGSSRLVKLVRGRALVSIVSTVARYGSGFRPPDSRVYVELGPRSYEVRVVTGRPDEFGPFVRTALEKTWSGSSCRTALIVTDSHLEELALAAGYEASLLSVGIESSLKVVPAGEASKSLSQASRLFDELVRRKADRHTLIVALGGGVVGDLAGFVAATFARGLPLIMVPTTLLAQVDSSVGGKVGINHPDAKNIIGSFYQPAGVWVDTESLRTLPARELRCGLAEVVKYGVILDAEFFDSLERDVESILSRDDGALRRIVIASCRLKAAVVTRDEREETGLRAVLNFGHTIGHMIEAVDDGPKLGTARSRLLARRRVTTAGGNFSTVTIRYLYRPQLNGCLLAKMFCAGTLRQAWRSRCSAVLHSR